MTRTDSPERQIVVLSLRAQRDDGRWAWRGTLQKQPAKNGLTAGFGSLDEAFEAIDRWLDTLAACDGPSG